MQPEKNVIEDAVQFLPNLAARIKLLVSLFQRQPLVFNEDRANAIVTILSVIKDDLTPDDILAYLNYQDDNGKTVGMATPSLTKDNSAYILLLDDLISRGADPVRIVKHLLLEDNHGQTVLHLGHLTALTDLCCRLKKTNSANQLLGRLFIKYDDNNINVIHRLKNEAENQPHVIYKLIEEGIIPEHKFAELADLIKPMLNANDLTVPDDFTHPIYMFARTAALELTRRVIANNNQERIPLLEWLKSSRLPLPIKMACLTEQTKNKDGQKESTLDSSLKKNSSDYRHYIALLSSLVTDETVDAIFEKLRTLDKLNASVPFEWPEGYFHLFNQLLDHGVSANEILTYLQHTRFHFPRVPNKEMAGAYLVFISSLVELDTPTDTIIALCNQILSLVNLATAISSNKTLLADYLAMLVTLAEKNKESALSIANLLLSQIQFLPTRSLMVMLFETNKCSRDALLALMITLRINGVSTDTLFRLLDNEQRYNFYDPVIPSLVFVATARRNMSFLFDLLQHNLLPVHLYPELHDKKESLLNFILTLPKTERVKALIHASSPIKPIHPLYAFMGSQRGFLPTRLNKGTYETIHTTLMEGVRTQQYANEIASLLLRSTKENTPVLKNRIRDKIVFIAKKDPAVLYILLNQNLIPHESYAHLASIEPLCQGLVSHLQRLSVAKKEALLLDYAADDNPFRVFAKQSVAVKNALEQLSIVTFGDQRSTLNALTKAEAAQKSIVAPTPEKIPSAPPATPPPTYLSTILMWPSVPENDEVSMEALLASAPQVPTSMESNNNKKERIAAYAN